MNKLLKTFRLSAKALEMLKSLAERWKVKTAPALEILIAQAYEREENANWDKSVTEIVTADYINTIQDMNKKGQVAKTGGGASEDN